MQCDFSTVRHLLGVMATYYPNMPLNVQLSFGYSRFLDLHLYNVNVDKPIKETYSLSRVLAYKELSSFMYTTYFSNIHRSYKHAVIPIYLYRIHSRNVHQSDIDNHLHFMYKILKTRRQDPAEVKRKTRSKQCREPDCSGCCLVKYDRVSRRHHFMSSLLKHSQSSLLLKYKSGSNFETFCKC